LRTTDQSHLPIGKSGKLKKGAEFKKGPGYPNTTLEHNNQLLIRTQSVKNFKLPKIPSGLLTVNQHLNEFYLTGGKRGAAQFSDS